MYEALRAYFLEGHPSQEAARAFGYSPGAFRVLCHQFRRDPHPQFFVSAARGPRTQPKKSKAREVTLALRSRTTGAHSVLTALDADRKAAVQAALTRAMDDIVAVRGPVAAALPDNTG